jgi:hypothetical protein
MARTQKKGPPIALEGPVERFEVVEIHRSQLKDAPYNPRLLSERAKTKLKAGIAKLGLLAPLTWNVRTGHIVAGHQRLSIIDGLKGTDDYTLRVAQVDLDEVREKEANLLMNNPEAQGEWDIEKLEQVIGTEGIELEATGFDVADVYRFFGAAPLQAQQIDELANRLHEAHGFYDDVATTERKGGVTDFYVVVVFKDVDDRDDFLRALKLEENRFQDGRELRRLYAEAGYATGNIPATEVTDPAELLKLRKDVQRELNKLREVARHTLEDAVCYFCKQALLAPAVFANHRPGDSRGGPLPEIGEVTEHHLDGDHTNNVRSNRVLCHDSCHRSYHTTKANQDNPKRLGT